MKLTTVEARAKRNKLDEFAGECYRDSNSQVVENLNKSKRLAYLGIQDSSGKYTILGEKYVYFSTEIGLEYEVSIVDILDILQKNAFDIGKHGQFEYLKVSDKKLMWVLDGRTMTAMWNIILLISRSKCPED